MSMNAGVHVPYAFMASSAPVSPALSKSAPSPDTSFEFPSIPPRLKSIGRQLSQMGENFLPPGADDSPNSRTSSVSRSRTVEEVPGMGDEPVLCPFCSKPLPPAIFTSHNHRPVKHGRGNLAMSPANAQKESLPAPKLLEPLSVAKPEKKEPTPLSTEGMQEMVQQGDEANMAAAKSILTSEEIEQWARRAGITLQPPKPAEPEKPIPALAPPPPPASKLSNPLAARSDSKAGPKFGFFSGSSTDAEGDSDSDGVGGGGAGYSRLTAPGSPTDDEGEIPKRQLHAEPDEIEYIVDEEKANEAVPNHKHRY
ncbi:hypothetical protein BCR39DRAFT_183654 [Naematelia encephala]|uniref:Uncharacterized protein n=1 Tax=Naematelia encephala TaxID=71784 RepID=A0A1Y2B2G1_9TREE|nr:hypothetical protein BCR39DRAFT_183654 [Naematelia encephala]